MARAAWPSGDRAFMPIWLKAPSADAAPLAYSIGAQSRSRNDDDVPTHGLVSMATRESTVVAVCTVRWVRPSQRRTRRTKTSRTKHTHTHALTNTTRTAQRKQSESHIRRRRRFGALFWAKAEKEVRKRRLPFRSFFLLFYSPQIRPLR